MQPLHVAVVVGLGAATAGAADFLRDLARELSDDPGWGRGNMKGIAVGPCLTCGYTVRMHPETHERTCSCGEGRVPGTVAMCEVAWAG